MRYGKPMTAAGLCLSAVVLVAVVGCSGSTTSGYGPGGGQSPNGGTSGMMGSGGSGGSGGAQGGGMMNNGGSGGKSYSSVGERIYLTGVGSDGRSISRTAPRVSQGSLMMGGGGCGSCHAANGRGGTIRMMAGSTIKSPDIRYAALIKAGFTDATIRSAIRDGLDESGKRLNVAMPRWRIADADADATIAYLKTLP